MIALALLLQAAAPGTTAPPPERFSILAGDCPAPTPGGDIVVCAAGNGARRLPLPDERPPVGPLPLPGSAERMVDPRPRPAGPAPCAAMMQGCTVGFGPNVMALAAGALKALKKAAAPKPDKTGRIPIPLDDPAPATPMR